MHTIGLEGLYFFARVGFYPEERILGNEIEVNVNLTIDTSLQNITSLRETVDYERVYESVKKVMQEEISLLETACFRIQHAIAGLSGDILKIKVRVSKIHPPLSGRAKQVYIEDEWVRA